MKNNKLLIGRLNTFLSQTFHRDAVTFPYVITIFVALIVVVFGIHLFVDLSTNLESVALANYDQQITEYVISHRSPSLTKYFVFITHVGDVYGYLLVLIGFAVMSAILSKCWKYMFQIIFVLSLSAISNMALKSFINRARPTTDHMVLVETLSFPSGHAMSAMAFYGFLIYLFCQFKINRLLKIAGILIALLLILSIGLSRIYLGVHFPSDIAGGFIAGFVCVIFCVLIFSFIDVFKSDVKTPDL